MNLHSLMSTAQEAVDLAAQTLRTQQPGELTAKGDRDYASEVDYQIEERVREFLAARTPDIGFVGEETAPEMPAAGPSWTLDPIDGTVNFAHDLPLCGVSLALVDGTQPLLGVIDLPFLQSRYTGLSGHGAYRDGRRLRTSTTSRLHEALVTIGDYAVGERAEATNRRRLCLTHLLVGRVLRIRMLGSAAVDLVWLAEGKTDASIALSNRPWDVAAGVVIAREAGAAVYDLDGSRHSTGSGATIASSPELAIELQDLLEVLNEPCGDPTFRPT